MKKKYEKLPNGEIDYSKVDLGNDFRDYPQIFNTPEDIEKIIKERGWVYPVLQNLLNLMKVNRFDLTPTEAKFYLEELFDYIYDVYRVPTEKTYVGVAKWLDHIENSLVFSGLSFVIDNAFQHVYDAYHTRLSTEKFFKENNIARNVAKLESINYFTDIGINEDYYNRTRENVIESFWIKTSRRAIQPVLVGDEAYARVHVYPDRVYIFGCDDSSYTLTTTTREEAIDFATYLKCASPVWCFSKPSLIHDRLEFTN